MLAPLLEVRPRDEPGWDTKPFGYIANTAGDDECFAARSVPGDLIVEACGVDGSGRTVRRIPRHWARFKGRAASLPRSRRVRLRTLLLNAVDAIVAAHDQTRPRLISRTGALTT